MRIGDGAVTARAAGGECREWLLSSARFSVSSAGGQCAVRPRARSTSASDSDIGDQDTDIEDIGGSDVRIVTS